MADSMAHRLGGRYEIRSLIGRGGMAEARLGFDTRLSRIVAIKMLRTDLARDSIFQTRFRREAQAAASLNHPNIVAVYDTGEEVVTTPDGSGVSVPYIVMEYVEGHTVKDLLADGTPVPIDEAVEIVSGVLSALEYSHSQSLVHRDIKPGNIMLTTDGKVKVMDFGIARALTDSQATMTQTNAVVGTAQYLSPEQARGEQVDARSDLYSTGIVLFELLTGRPPFKGDSAVAVAYQHVSSTPPLPSSITPDIPESLDRVVMKCLAKDREDRYSSAASMRSDLIRAVHGADVDAPATQVWETAALANAGSSSGATATMPLSQMSSPPPPPPSYTNRNRAQYADTSVATEEEAELRKKRTGLIVALVILLIGALGIGAVALMQSNKDPEKATVPDALIGMTQEEAKQAVEGAGLVFAIGDPVESEDVEEGRVAQSDPPPSTQVEEGSSVTVFLSSGPASQPVPDVTGNPVDQARTILENAGFEVKVSDQKKPSDDIAEGSVVETSPKAKEMAKKGSTVTLIVSSGSNQVAVPDVNGMSQEQARSTIEAAGLRVGSVTSVDSAEQAKDRVVSSAPAAGEKVAKDSEITLQLASGNVAIPAGLPGQSQEAVVNALKELKLVPDVYEMDSNDVAKGMVVNVEPGEGQLVSQGGTVKVYVSRGSSSGSQSGN